MREFVTPSTYRPPTTGNLTDDVVRNDEEHPDVAVFALHGPEGWYDVTAARFATDVRSLAKGLIASGVRPGDRVALLCSTRYEWTLVDYALWFAGAVSVPVYESAAPDQVAWILEDSGAVAAVVEQTAQRARVEQALAPELVWCLQDGALADLGRLGERISTELLEDRRTTAGPGSLATLVYTSGTTGPPKGCRLTHGCFLTELGVAVPALGELFEEGATTLLFLPLAHVLARVVQVGAVHTRTRLAFTARITDLGRDLAEVEPTFVLAVPRVFERLFTTASQQAAAEGRSRRFDGAAEAAIAYSRALESGSVGAVLRARHRILDRLVYARLRASLGGCCRYAISGGAPLGERLAHFYRGIGVTVLEGYGLTETTAAVTLNVPGAVKLGTVGRPLGGTAVRVAEDGELQVRGGQVFDGYWRNDEATAAARDGDGWLRTGDLGEIDEEGFVRVTGRKNEILVTLGGKNVAPALLEDAVRTHPLVAQCLVVGDGRPFVAALVTLERDAVTQWARGRLPGGPHAVAQLADDPDLRAEIQLAVDAANRTVSHAEAIRRFTVLPDDWSEEGGQLTPSLKLRRRVVLAQVRSEVESLYSHAPSPLSD